MNKPPLLTLEELVACGEVRALAVSPDGKKIAYVWDRDGVAHIYVIPAGGGFPRRVSPHGVPVEGSYADSPAWSPDGRWLAYVAGPEPAQRRLWVVGVEGGSPRPLTVKGLSIAEPRWSPDGKWIAGVLDVEEHRRVVLVPFGQGDEMGWMVPISPAEVDATDPQWAPDGNRIAFVLRTGPDSSAIWMATLQHGAATGLVELVGGDCWNHSPRWSPCGQALVFVSDRTGWAQLWLLSSGEREPRPVTHGTYEVSDPAWAPDGRRIAFVRHDAGNATLRVWVGSGTEAVVGPRYGVVKKPAWVGQGEALAYLYASARTPTEIWLTYMTNTSSEESIRLTWSSVGGVERAPLVEPECVYYKSRDGLRIHALLYRPPDTLGPVPAIVFPHGGPTSQHVNGWYPFLQYFVLKGYAILAPNFRGSTGYGRAYEMASRNLWGKADLDDVVAGLEWLESQSWVARGRVAIWGASYGGYLTLLALTKHPGRFACGVDMYGVSNRFTSWRDTDRLGRVNMERKIGRPASNVGLYREASPITYVQHLREPLLILHGEDDTRVPISQSVEMVEALRRIGKWVEFHRYPGEGHGFRRRENLLDVYTRIETFFSLYL